jgi:hypothetical protein
MVYFRRQSTSDTPVKAGHIMTTLKKQANNAFTDISGSAQYNNSHFYPPPTL